jgi:hypothetical protein
MARDQANTGEWLLPLPFPVSAEPGRFIYLFAVILPLFRASSFSRFFFSFLSI